MIEGLKSAGVKTRTCSSTSATASEFMDAGYAQDRPRRHPLGRADGRERRPVPGSTTLSSATTRSPATTPTSSSGWTWSPTATTPRTTATYRSHLGMLVTRVVNKIVALPVLKDHGSAGVTGALKNMSHGSVNNVARSHSNTDTNVCNQFIPQVVSHPIIRKKCVLQIMDGIRGVYQGGPFAARHGKWTWENNALFFATDPVAMDHVEWDIIDAKRQGEGCPPVGASGKLRLDPLGTEGFDIRQPQHIALAGDLGLGIFDFKSPRGRRVLDPAQGREGVSSTLRFNRTESVSGSPPQERAVPPSCFTSAAGRRSAGRTSATCPPSSPAPGRTGPWSSPA